MTYKYTTEGCFTKLLKQPPLPIDNPDVVKAIAHMKRHLNRRWLHNGCAVEEIGRFGYMDCNKPVYESALAYHLEDLLLKPQPIENNDGVGAAERLEDGTCLFNSRFVIAALVDNQIKAGMEKVLIDYCGFTRLAPYHGNTKHYGDTSRVGIYGVCCTRYVVDEEKKAKKK